MAINKNHEFEELDSIKCGIVEKNVTTKRVQFLKSLLEYNHFKVIVVPSPPAKVATKPAIAKAEDGADIAPISEIVSTENPTFTIGVTDYTFNAINAIFGRLLKTSNGQIVTQAYWQQQEPISNDEVPYFEFKK